LGLPGALIALKRNDLDDQFTGGSRLVVGHTFDDSRYQVEASYLWQAPWTATASVSDLPSLLNGTVGNLFSPFTNFGSPPDTRVDYDNFVRIHEVSWLNSEEIDLKGVIFSSEDMAVKLLAGLRHVGISEQFDYYAQPTTLLADPTKVDPTRTPNTVNAITAPRVTWTRPLPARPIRKTGSGRPPRHTSATWMSRPSGSPRTG
jgi:hypothetical protein